MNKFSNDNILEIIITLYLIGIFVFLFIKVMFL